MSGSRPENISGDGTSEWNGRRSEARATPRHAADLAGAIEQPVVLLDNVKRVYPGSPPVHALGGVSMRIGPGEMVGIVGPSGSGKSTLLNILGTLDRADSGLVRIDGHDVNRLSDRQLSTLRARRIGFVFQQFFLSPGVTALDNVADGLLYTGLSLRKRRAGARTHLEHVGLADRMYHKPHELSGGQKQRVAVARALVGTPSFLLADEPTGALDSASGAAVLKLLHELHDAGTTIVVITHDHAVAAQLPRQVRILDGRVESDERAHPADRPRTGGSRGSSPWAHTEPAGRSA